MSKRYFKSPIKWIFVGKKFIIKSHKLNKKEKNGKKWKRAEKLGKTRPKSPKIAKRWNFDSFFFISRPPFIFSNFFLFCWVCVICTVILSTINLDLMAIFYPKKNPFREDLKLMFCHFRQRRWTLEIFSFGKSVLFLWHTPKIIWGKYIFKLFIFSHRPMSHVLPCNL